MSLISASRCLAGAQHALERLELVFPLQVDGVLVQHLGHADDRI